MKVTLWVTAIGSSDYVQVNVGKRKPKTHYYTDDTWSCRAAKKILGVLPRKHRCEWIRYEVRVRAVARRYAAQRNPRWRS